MEDRYLDLKKEIQKINQRVKEYLWEESNTFKIRVSQPSNARS